MVQDYYDPHKHEDNAWKVRCVRHKAFDTVADLRWMVQRMEAIRGELQEEALFEDKDDCLHVAVCTAGIGEALETVLSALGAFEDDLHEQVEGALRAFKEEAA